MKERGLCRARSQDRMYHRLNLTVLYSLLQNGPAFLDMTIQHLAYEGTYDKPTAHVLCIMSSINWC